MVIFPTFAVPHVPLKTGFMVVTTAVVFLHALPTGGVVLHCLEVPPGGESLRKHKVTESQGGYSLLADPAKCSRHDMSWSCTDLAFLRLVFSCFLEGFSASKSEISCFVSNRFCCCNGVFFKVNFLPLDIRDEEDIALVLHHADYIVQYGEDLEPKQPKDDVSVNRHQ